MHPLPFLHRRPVMTFWLVAVGLELLLIPLFLLTGADAAIERGLGAAGLDFNTDLVTAGRVVVAEPAALWGVLLSLGQVASPDIAVLIVTGLLLRGDALREVARRFRFWSPEVGAGRGLRLWTACVVTFCAMNVASAGLHALGPDRLEFSWDPRPVSFAFVGGLLVAMFLDAGALFEENGWRGFALPRLQDRFGPLRAAVAVGLLWAAWHLPVKFDLLLDYGAAPFGLLFCVLVAKFVALSVVMSFFFNRAGEATILAVAMHGLSNDSVRLGGLVDSDAFAAQLRAEIDLLIPLAVVALSLVALTSGRLGTEPWDNGRVLRAAVLRPFRRSRAGRRLGLELAAALTGAAYAVVLAIAVPILGALSIIGVGIPLVLTGLAAARALAGWEGRRCGPALGVGPLPLPVARADAAHGLLDAARRLVRAPQTWRAVGWIGTRAAAGAAASVILLITGLAALSLALIPFIDEWLVWGSWRTDSGVSGGWTLLLAPVPVLVAVHVLDVLGTGLAALAPRLLGPDPAEELELLRNRARRLRDRARLASELHDAIGHTLTVVTLQAAAAGRALDDDPEAARGALSAIEHAGRRAAEQLDGVLATLGAKDGDDTTPEPGLTDLPELVAAMRAAGVDARLETSGTLTAVSAPLAGELYRMAQEACANVMRHAGMAATVVAVTVGPDRVTLEIRNAGGGIARPAMRSRASSGRGLPSIALRARRLGGSADAGGSADGSFRVRVEVPLVP